MINIHHLELFYYVARHGGISEAVRHMPYGIQQPAMSSQVILLEDDLGLTLFQRRPFQLTPGGQELYAFIKPFFDNLEPMAARLRGGGRYEHLRIGAAEIVLRDHLPVPLQELRKKFPDLRVTLRSGYLPQLESWLQRQEIDVAVTLLDGKQPGGINSLPLLKLSLGLLVPKASRIQSPDDLWKRDKLEEQLIALPVNEPITKNFQQHLTKIGVDWFPSIEVSSLDVMEAYVGNGYGIGLTLVVPKTPLPTKARLLPLPDFPTVTIGALWTGKPTPIIQAFVNQLQERVKLLLA